MSREYENKQKASAADILKTLSRNSVALIGSVLILMMIIATIFSPHFLTIFNLQSLMRDIAFIGMVAVAQSLLLLIGELDLSVGKIATLSGVLGGILMTSMKINPFLAFAIGLLSGILFGVINGLLVTKLRLNSMVTTIGMQSLYGGITLVITKGKAVTNIPDAIFFLGKGNIGVFPIPFIFAIVVLIVIVYFVTKTKTGRYIYAIGNSREASKSSYIWNRRIYLCTGRNALRCKIGVGTGGNWKQLADEFYRLQCYRGCFSDRWCRKSCRSNHWFCDYLCDLECHRIVWG